MTGKIFRDWILWFNRQVAGRRVILLLDGFSAHRTGLKYLAAEDVQLPNIRVHFLPENTTSLCQPLDQGIIRTWKAYYRQLWLRFAVEHFEKDEDPARYMDVLQAVRWAIQAWFHDVTEATIRNCWVRQESLPQR